MGTLKDLMRFIFLLNFVENSLSDCNPAMWSTTKMITLHKDLFCDYNSDIRPVLKPEKVTNISFFFTPKTFRVDHRTHYELSVSINLLMSWKDEFLTWNPYSYGDVKLLHLNNVDIWVPPIVHYIPGGSKIFYEDMNLMSKIDKKFTITNSGMVYYSAKSVFTFYCESNLYSWPYDRLNCSFLVGIPDSYQRIISFTTWLRLLGFFKLGDLPDWKVISSREGPGNLCKRTNCSILYEIQLQRQHRLFTATVVLPEIFLCILCLVPFWCKNSMWYYRLYVWYAVIFSQIGYLLSLQTILTIDFEPILLFSLFRCVLLICMLGVMVTIMNCKLYPKTSTAPMLLSKFHQAIFGLPSSWIHFIHLDNEEEEDEITLLPKSNGKEWRLLAKFFDRIAFFISFIIICKYFVNLFIIILF